MCVTFKSFFFSIKGRMLSKEVSEKKTKKKTFEYANRKYAQCLVKKQSKHGQLLLKKLKKKELKATSNSYSALESGWLYRWGFLWVMSVGGEMMTAEGFVGCGCCLFLVRLFTWDKDTGIHSRDI